MTAYDLLTGDTDDDILGDEIGAGMIPLASVRSPEPALVIRVRNAPELVAKQGGAMGKLAFDIAPASITAKIYSEMQKEMLTKFREKGVVADVQVVTSPPSGPPPKAEFLRGMAAGGVGVGIVYGLWRLIRLLIGR